MKPLFKQLISFFLCCAILLSATPVVTAQRNLPAESSALPSEISSADNVSSTRSNTEVPRATYYIDTPEAFMAIMDDPNGFYYLTSDLDLGNITPLGYDPETGTVAPFTGTLEGNGHTITYTITDSPSCAYYGLFAIAQGASVCSLNLVADILITDTQQMDCGIGTIAGRASDTSFSGINVTGMILVNATAGDQTVSVDVAGLSGTGSANAYNCYLDLDVSIASESYKTKIGYWGICDGSASHCILSGNAVISGSVEDFFLLKSASDCISTQNVSLSGSCSYVYLDYSGHNNQLNGYYSIPTQAGYDTSYAANALLYGCTGSTLSGTLVGRNIVFARRCTGVTVDMDGDYTMVCGLVACTNSILNASFSANKEFTAAKEGSNNQIYLEADVDVSQIITHTVMLRILDKETHSLLDVDLNMLCRSYDLAVMNECSYCTFTGSLTLDDTSGGVVGPLVRDGSHNMVTADITYWPNHGSTLSELTILSNEEGSYFGGSVTTNQYLFLIDGKDCYGEGSIYSSYCTLFSENTVDSCFMGSVQCRYFEPFKVIYYSDDYPCATNCYVYADVTMSYENAEYYTVDTRGNNCWFDGTITVPYCDYAEIISSTPATVTHKTFGTENTANFPNKSIGCHSYEYCQHGCSSYWACYDNTFEMSSHYSRKIISVIPEDGSDRSATATSNWSGSIDPIDKTYKPQTDDSSYTIRVVDFANIPLSGGYVTLNSATYTLDANGCVTVSEGPGAVVPLIVSAADSNGTVREIYRVECLFPVPNQVNTIVMEPEVNIEINLLDENADLSSAIANGATVDAGGTRFDMLSLEMTPELDLQLGDINVAFSANPQTGLIEVIASTSHLESGKADNWKTTWNTYVKGIADGKIPPSESKKVKFLGMECDISLAVTLQIEYDMRSGAFRVVDGGGYLGIDGENRITKPFPIPAFYWTVAAIGGIQGSVSAHATYNEVVNTAITKMIGQAAGYFSVEGALGVGVRPAANMYAEAGLQGQLAGSLDFPFRSAAESATLSFTGDFFVEARVWTLGDRLSWSLANVQLWPNPETQLARLTSQMNLTALPRNYIKQTGTYSVQSTRAKTFSTTVSDQIADYPYSEMAIRQLESGNYLLVYTDDDPSRTDADRSVLRAVLGTPDSETGELVWGQHITIDDDGTGDYSFSVSVSGNSAAVVWQDMNTVFGDAKNLTTAVMAEHVDLSCAILDCYGNAPVVKALTSVTQDNKLCEGVPFVYYKEDYYSENTLRIAWVTSTENDPMVVSDSEVYTLWLDGTAVATSQRPISSIAVLTSELLWSSQTDTANDLWLLDSSGIVTQCKADGIKDLQSKGDYFCFTEGDSLYKGNGSYSTLGERNIDPVFLNTILLSDNGTIYYLENGLNGSRIHTVRNATFCPVTEFDGFISCWDISAGYAVALVKQGFATEDTSDDSAYLLCKAEQNIEDLRVGELYCADPTAAPGTSVDFSVKLANYGTTYVTSVPVKVLCADGTVLFNESISFSQLNSGESTVVSFTVPIPYAFVTQEVTVAIGDTSQTMTLGRTNLSLEVNWDPIEPGYMTVTVRNTGNGEASGILTVSDGTEVLLSQEVTVDYREEFTINFTKYYQSETLITATITENTANSIADDNEVSVAVIYPPQEALSVKFETLVLTTGQSAQPGYTCFPADAALPLYTYTTSDASIAQVDAQGTVTAIGPGRTQITATDSFGRTVSFSVQVLQIDGTYHLNETKTITLEPGEALYFNFTPAQDGQYVLHTPWDYPFDLWIYGSDSSISAEYVYTYDIYACRMDMQADQTYTLKIYNSWDQAVTCDVTLSENQPVEQVRLSISEIELFTTDVLTLYVVPEPATAFSTYNWSISDENTAQFSYVENTSCRIILQQSGTVVVTATAENGQTASCTITVIEPETLLPGESRDVILDANAFIKFKFTPDQTGEYVFYTNNDVPFDLFFLKDGYSLETVPLDRDGLIGIHATLEAGATYYIAPLNTASNVVEATVWFDYLSNLSCVHQYTEEVTDPTCTASGYTTYTCVNCSNTYIADQTDALGHDYQGGTCSRCGEADPDYAEPVVNPFTDVKERHYFYQPVLWAVKNGVTAGTSATTFSPDEICTRGQVVTFLWRAMGEPEPNLKVNPFTDVREKDYYYKAVLWAVEKGITTGTGEGKFSPKEECTRGQVVTFLWRAMGQTAPVTGENPFGDVRTRDYFYEPVLWAVERGITTGTGEGVFSPKEACTRGQVVTFLYRAMANP